MVQYNTQITKTSSLVRLRPSPLHSSRSTYLLRLRPMFDVFRSSWFTFVHGNRTWKQRNLQFEPESNFIACRRMHGQQEVDDDWWQWMDSVYENEYSNNEEIMKNNDVSLTVFWSILHHENDKVPFLSIRLTPRHHASWPPLLHRAYPQGVFPPSVKSPPDVEMRRGIDHVITVLQRLTARVDRNHGAARTCH